MHFDKLPLIAAAFLLSLSTAWGQVAPDDYFAIGAGVGNSYGFLGVKAQKRVQTGNIPGAASLGLGVFPVDGNTLLGYSFNYKAYLFDNFEVFYIKAGFETTRYSYDYATDIFGDRYKTNYEMRDTPVIGAGIDTWIADHVALNLGSGVGMNEWRSAPGYRLDGELVRGSLSVQKWDKKGL